MYYQIKESINFIDIVKAALRCEDLMLIFAMYDSKLNIWGVWTEHKI